MNYAIERMRYRTQTKASDSLGLIPVAEMFGQPLPGWTAFNADVPFQERLAIAWEHLLTEFTQQERARLKLTVSLPATATENIESLPPQTM